MTAGQVGRVPAHYIRHNLLSRVPRNFVSIAVGGEFLTPSCLTWRSAVAIFATIPKDSGALPTAKIAEFAAKADLWAAIAEAAGRDGKIVVSSLALADDIRLSDGIGWLVANGWLMDRLNVRDEAFSGAFHKGKARIVLTDLRSWLNTSARRVGAFYHLDVLNTPALEAKADRRHDVIYNRAEATHSAGVDLWTWIRDDDLGNWKPTGAGQAWANWRHAHYTDKVLMHGRPDLMEIERQAAATGRAEAWKHGEWHGVEFTEWDLPLAYPQIALDVEVPIAYSGTMRGASLRLMTNPPKGKRYLIEATVTNLEGELPIHTASGWAWPSGTARGWWWDVELGNAIAEGAKVTAHQCHYYIAAPALADWAGWLFEYLKGGAPGTTPVRLAAAKHWGRGLIGRFGVRYEKWDKFSPAPRFGYYTTVLHDYEAGTTTPALVLGGELFVSTAKDWGHDAIPQVMSAIMAECRVRLWQIMAVAGAENVVYVDTDSVIVNSAGSLRLTKATARGELWGLRPKFTYTELEILGPRQLMASSRSKVSGVPLDAERTGALTFEGEITDGIARGFFKGATDSIAIDARQWKLGARDNRRAHLAGGETAPYRASVVEGETVVDYDLKGKIAP